MSVRGMFRKLLVFVLALGVIASCAGCGLVGQKDREMQLQNMETELAELGDPVIGARVEELGSGMVKYVNVSVQVEYGTESFSEDTLRQMLTIVAQGTPERYPSVDLRVGTPDHKALNLSKVATEIGVDKSGIITGAGTLAFNRVELVEMVDSW